MSFEIKKVTRKQQKIRLGLFGPSGSGKTWSAILVAKGLAKGDMSKVLFIDTENGSASFYDHLGEFNAIDMEPPYSPTRFVEAIKQGENLGCEVIIIDSITHEWNGEGGCLDIHNKLGGKFQDWSRVNEYHKEFVDAIRFSKSHIIVCGRAKQEYDFSKNDKGKSEVTKLGMGAVTGKDFEYDLTIGLELTMKNMAVCDTVGKDRSGLFKNQAPHILTEDDGKKILEWCERGEKDPAPLIQEFSVLATAHPELTPEKMKAHSGLDTLNGKSYEEIEQGLDQLKEWIAKPKPTLIEEVVTDMIRQGQEKAA